jgi:hypothetical protein
MILEEGFFSSAVIVCGINYRETIDGRKGGLLPFLSKNSRETKH